MRFFLIPDSEVLEKYGKPIAERFAHTRLILGNHDTDNAYRLANVGRMVEMFDAVHGLKSQYGFWISHAPMHPAELRGKPNIHGHVHFATVPDDNYINVCCENVDYRPIDLQLVRNGWRSYDNS